MTNGRLATDGAGGSIFKGGETEARFVNPSLGGNYAPLVIAFDVAAEPPDITFPRLWCITFGAGWPWAKIHPGIGFKIAFHPYRASVYFYRH